MLLRQVPDTDITNSLVSNVRVLAAGLTKIQNQNKQKAKEVKSSKKKAD
jgi:hypothetical protein